jgi:hypothetical protein
MGGNCLATLGKVPTAGFHLESRRYVFKILKKFFINSKKP